MRLLPVIHPVRRKEAMESIEVAVDAGITGIFLINQGMEALELERFIPVIAKEFPLLWLGLNLLGHKTKEAEILNISGIWTDNAETVESPEEGFLYFGGVDFKYQTPVPPWKYAEVVAKHKIDVATTSGPATGKPPTLEKIQKFREVYDGRLAIASGITPDNVDPFLPLVDYFLVATGIEKRFGVLDPAKVKVLQEKMYDKE